MLRMLVCCLFVQLNACQLHRSGILDVQNVSLVIICDMELMTVTSICDMEMILYYYNYYHYYHYCHCYHYFHYYHYYHYYHFINAPLLIAGVFSCVH